MSGKFTPGPWRIGTNTGHNGNTIYASDEGALASVYGLYHHTKADGQPEGEAKANARLIVAAPDMYAALRDILAATVHTETMNEICQMGSFEAAREAIAKAEGKL